MKLIVHRRAEIALRTLTKTAQRKILKAFEILNSVEEKNISDLPYVSVLRTTGDTLYSYRGTNDLRLILSLNNDSCIVEDIVGYENFERFFKKSGC